MDIADKSINILRQDLLSIGYKAEFHELLVWQVLWWNCWKLVIKICCSLLQHYSGLEEAVFRNIRACKELSQTTRTAYGPNGKHSPPTASCICLVFDPLKAVLARQQTQWPLNYNTVAFQVWTKWSSTTWRSCLSPMMLQQFSESLRWGNLAFLCYILPVGMINRWGKLTVIVNVFLLYRCSIQLPKWLWWHPTCKSRRLETVQILSWCLLELCWSWLKSCSGWACLCQR